MSPEVSSLHCPNCGAAVDPDAGRCPYCKARLATISCASCFAPMFDGSAFCPKCGARAMPRQETAAAGRCPGCRGSLRQLTLGDTTLLECAACDGVWMDAAEFERVCANREAQTAVMHRFAGPARAVRRVQYRPCLRCGKMMNRVNFGKLSGTIVDVCRGHGTFMDSGELHQIVTFIQSGGIERAREQQLEELKEEEQRLRDMERRIQQDRPVIQTHIHTSDSWDKDALRALLDAIRDDK